MTDEQIPADPDAADADPEKEEDDAWLLGPDEWPTTVEAGVARVLSELSDEDKRALRDMKRDDLILLHFGLAQWIRNAFGLWRGNQELLDAIGHPYFDADGASMVIVEKVWEVQQARS